MTLGARPHHHLDTLGRHHCRPTTHASLSVGVHQATPGVLPDRVDAKLREHGNNAEQRVSHRRGGIDIGLGQTLMFTPASCSSLMV